MSRYDHTELWTDKASEEISENPRPEGMTVSRAILRGLCVLCAAAAVFAAAWLLPASAQMNMGSTVVKRSDFNAIMEADITNAASSALGDIYELPKIFLLPVSCAPAPVPKEENFSVVLTEKGDRIEQGSYVDSTISVKVWKEQRDNTVYNFADVQINHPSQFRTMFATGDYETATWGETPLNMAKQSNAVVAISSDFCRYNMNGTVIVRGGDFYKYAPAGWEVLLVDSNGDFLFAVDNDIEFEQNGGDVVFDGHVIYNTFSFGPVLVRDGVAVTDYSDIKAAIHGMYLTGKATVARAAIGQLGELHYLLCTVDGTRSEVRGVRLPQLAEVLVEKGCVNAYNLDGGHSATLVFNNRLVNIPASKDDTGSQRVQSDIIYFATAIPEK